MWWRILFVSGLAVAGFALVVALMPPTVCGAGQTEHIIGDIRALKAQLEQHRRLNGTYPTTEETFSVLGNVLKDPWGVDYFYSCPGKRYSRGYDLFSAGPDRQPYTADDEWGEES